MDGQTREDTTIDNNDDLSNSDNSSNSSLELEVLQKRLGTVHVDDDDNDDDESDLRARTTQISESSGSDPSALRPYDVPCIEGEQQELEGATAQDIISANDKDDQTFLPFFKGSENDGQSDDRDGTSPYYYYTMICDCGYGWPTQKRPRSERLRAVCRQIYNFLHWREKDYTTCTTDRTRTAGNHNNSPTYTATAASVAELIIIGEGEQDVTPIERQFLARIGNSCSTRNGGYMDNNQPHVRFEKEPLTTWIGHSHDQERRQSTTSSTKKHTIIYLSPDASDVLDVEQPPPGSVIIGMLVDRKIKKGRSRTRSEELSIKSYKLPLGLVKLEGLYDSEPLNIDTVMELMQRWWTNYTYLIEQLKQQQQQHTQIGRKIPLIVPSNVECKQCFLDAAVHAMLSHQDRHPKRTLHT